MSEKLDKEKWDAEFQQAKSKAYEVTFPDGLKAMAQVLKPVRIEELKDRFFAAADEMGEFGLGTFTLKNGTKIKGTDRTKKTEEKKDGKGNVIKDKDGNPVLIKAPVVRIEKPTGEIVEFPRVEVEEEVHYPTNADFLSHIEQFLWKNAAEVLGIIFPDQKDAFTGDYVKKHLDVPFMKTLYRLVVEQNELGDILPFVSEFLKNTIWPQIRAAMGIGILSSG